jgi:hypothetical protein
MCHGSEHGGRPFFALQIAGCGCSKIPSVLVGGDKASVLHITPDHDLRVRGWRRRTGRKLRYQTANLQLFSNQAKPVLGR